MAVTGTTSVTPDRRLGDLVAERAGRARVLERLGLDYCCHGDRSLAVACASAGLDVEAVAIELGAVDDADESGVDHASPAELLDHIVATHHAYLDAELPAPTALADKVRDVHGGRHPELAEVARLVHVLRDDLEPHLRREERVVFPAIRRLLAGDGDDALAHEVAALAAEHEQAGELLASLRAACDGYAWPSDGCASYRSLFERLAALEQDTFRHIHLENNVLFPGVLTA